MSMRDIRAYIGEPRRRRIAGHVLHKRCAGMEGKPSGEEAADAVRRLASGEPTEKDEDAWEWALPGMRDDELKLLMGWGAVKPRALARRRVRSGGKRSVEKEEKRLIEMAKGIRLHGAMICRSREDLGPEALKTAKRLDRTKEGGQDIYWLRIGAQGRIGIPWTIIEDIQAGVKRATTRHTPTKRPHYIPVWLSSGFAEPRERSGKIKVYRRSAKDVYVSSPGHWGVETTYYSTEEMSADPLLDEWDAKDAAVIRRLRKEGGAGPGWARPIPAILTRLVLRRATTREMLEVQAESLRQGWKQLAAEERQEEGDARERLARRLRTQGRGLRELAEEDLRRMGVREEQLDEQIEVWMNKAAERVESLDRDVLANATEQAPDRARLLGKLDEKAEHIHLVKEELEKEGGFAKYARDMEYVVQRCSEPVLRLGDSVVVESRIGYGVPHDPLQEPDRPLEAVYLPIASDLILMGRKRGEQFRELGWILAACARLARDSFITARRADEYAERERGRIGECREEANKAKGYQWAIAARDRRDG